MLTNLGSSVALIKAVEALFTTLETHFKDTVWGKQKAHFYDSRSLAQSRTETIGSWLSICMTCTCTGAVNTFKKYCCRFCLWNLFFCLSLCLSCICGDGDQWIAPWEKATRDSMLIHTLMCQRRRGDCTDLVRKQLFFLIPGRSRQMAVKGKCKKDVLFSFCFVLFFCKGKETHLCGLSHFVLFVC